MRSAGPSPAAQDNRSRNAHYDNEQCSNEKNDCPHKDWHITDPNSGSMMGEWVGTLTDRMLGVGAGRTKLGGAVAGIDRHCGPGGLSPAQRTIVAGDVRSGAR